MNNDSATGACRLVGARPVEHGRGSYLRSIEKISPANGGSMGSSPWAASPSGERGGYPRNFRASSKNTTDSYEAKKFIILTTGICPSIQR